MKEREITIQEIADILDIEYMGKDNKIESLNLCNRETMYNSIVSYITSLKFVQYLNNNNKIRALFLDNGNYDKISKDFPEITNFVVESPEECFYQLHS